MTTASIEKPTVSAYKIPTDQPESDGTYIWDSTTNVIVEAENFLQSMAKGDPERPSLVRGAMKDAVESFIPHRN